jgi:hypothetical protein
MAMAALVARHERTDAAIRHPPPPVFPVYGILNITFRYAPNQADFLYS